MEAEAALAFRRGGPGPGRGASLARGCDGAPGRRTRRRPGAAGAEWSMARWRTGCGSTTSCRPQPDRRRPILSRRGALAWGETTHGWRWRCAASSTRGPADDAVGRPARAGVASAARAHPRPGTSARWSPRLDEFERTVTPAGPACAPRRPHRPDAGQHPDRRRRLDHRDHRLRRHEPLGADHRPRIGARLARRRA